MIEAHGDPGNWPFDSYKTELLSADVFVGSGEDRKRIPAQVEVRGSLDGWDASVSHVGDVRESGGPHADNSSVVVTLHRAKGR